MVLGSRGCSSCCSGLNSTSSRSGWDHARESLSSSSIIAEEENLIRETETLVAPTRYAAVTTDEERTTLRGDRSSQLSGDSAYFQVAAGKASQSTPTALIPTVTQETGYCTETATQGEIPVLSHNGKHQTYHRMPCESGTHLGRHEAIETLTTTNEVGRDNVLPLDDDRTSSLPAVKDSTEGLLDSLSPPQPQAHVSQNSSVSSNSTRFFHTGYDASLTDSGQHKAGETAPAEPSCLSLGKQSAATSQLDSGVLPGALAGQTRHIHSSTSDQELAHDIIASRVPHPHLATSVQATDDVDVSHLTDLVVTVAQLPKSMARSMTVNVHR